MVIPLARASTTAWNVLHSNGEHEKSQEEDARREKVLSALGLRIVRFGNDEVVRSLSAVVGKIRDLSSISK
ncbi:MAG: DUF559 domain-containing protein [Methylomicrobium sp.]|nr:DUF559 domain-containing protein [Methylomicrobium sp.]